ncbi:TMEM175 family protein [Hymenobacter psoromatis]|uniref:TMEM175 family protein n=1 Tax=Hymenobacter psoromatis TaxID=1484116 RepID=UPI001CBC29B2|nr:TMEM175 family protein [Hymenobacter psoromatis]
MSQSDTALDHHDRTEFQLERLILFTDAVFAIAITLLAIEIRFPEFGHRLPSNTDIWRGLGELVPKFMGFLIGFVIIAQYWTAHHRIFRFVRNYDTKLLWLNILFLMFIVLMPFSSGVFSSYAVVAAAFTIYAINIMLAGLAQVLLLRYLLNPAHQLILPEDRTHPDLDTWRPLVAVAGFGVALLVVQLLPSQGIWILLIPFTALLVIPFSWLHRRRHARLLRAHLALRQPALEPEAALEPVPTP